MKLEDGGDYPMTIKRTEGDAILKPEERTKILLAAYSEVCRSYHAIDDFRTKLLGVLPLTSLAGVFLIDTNKSVFSPTSDAHVILGFAGIFAALLTLALFGYEVRGMRELTI